MSDWRLTFENVDFAILDALLANIEWDRERMESAIGRPINPRMPHDVKRLILQIIEDKGVRFALAKCRSKFPDAIITAVGTPFLPPMPKARA